ncbi:MAG: hypothetical protein K2H64_02135 [Desulfovibrio sp.]|nr:hypothetical protein [Desulfovibrio sp.]
MKRISLLKNIVILSLVLLSILYINAIGAQEPDAEGVTSQKSLWEQALDLGKRATDKTIEFSKDIKDSILAKFMDDNDPSLREYNELFKEDEQSCEGDAENFELEEKIFSYIAKTKEYSVIVIALLGNNAPERVLNMMENLHIIGAVASISKALFFNQISWLNTMLKDKGQKYVMENLAKEFAKQNISIQYLIHEINSMSDIVLARKYKDESIDLLNKYYTN